MENEQKQSYWFVTPH
jgi:hypothetical protein